MRSHNAANLIAAATERAHLERRQHFNAAVELREVHVEAAVVDADGAWAFGYPDARNAGLALPRGIRAAQVVYTAHPTRCILLLQRLLHGPPLLLLLLPWVTLR